MVRERPSLWRRTAVQAEGPLKAVTLSAVLGLIGPLTQSSRFPVTATLAAEPKGCPEPDYPIGLSQVRGVVLDPSSDGPVAEDGGLTTDWIRRRAAAALQAAGLQAFQSSAEALQVKVYAPRLMLEVHSIAGTTDGAPYFFLVEGRLFDSTTYLDGTRGNVVIWSVAEFGSRDGPKLVPRVTELVDKTVGKLVAAIREARGHR